MSEIESVKKEYQALLQQLSDPELISNLEKGDESKDSSSPFAGARVFEELTKRKSFLEEIIEKGQEIEDLKNKIEENKEILKSHEDKELFSLAETEIVQMNEKLKNLETDMERLRSENSKNSKESMTAKAVVAETSSHLSPRPASPSSVIVEIRAGTGGQEAALFVADLFKMYSKYAILQNWKQKVLDSRPSELGGFKEITFEIAGEGIFSKIRKEAGVHRVQRIPTTEKTDRIHTSTASVAVLAKPKKGKITINPNDLKIDTYKASGPGGQYVNKRMTAVRITHLPTGLVVTSQTERNLQQNKENALDILEARLLEKKEGEESVKVGQERRSQIGEAKRAEKIRTYNFPQDRVTDHRIKKSFHNLQEIMEGKLEPIIKELLR